jgi:hypothetical protein
MLPNITQQPCFRHAERLEQIGLSRYIETETITGSGEALQDWLTVTFQE